MTPDYLRPTRLEAERDAAEHAPTQAECAKTGHNPPPEHERPLSWQKQLYWCRSCSARMGRDA